MVDKGPLHNSVNMLKPGTTIPLAKCVIYKSAGTDTPIHEKTTRQAERKQRRDQTDGA